MSGELEAAAADALSRTAGEGTGRHPPPDSPCANCGAMLQGPFCHVCGQNGDTHKRSILHLAWEGVEGLFHFDGRLRRTLPDLFFRPGRLTADYLAGRLARHVPPFRTFLVALLLFIFAAEHAIHGMVEDNARHQATRAAELATPAGRAAEAVRVRREALQQRDDDLKEAAADRAEGLKDADDTPANVQAAYVRDVTKAQTAYAAATARADRILSGQPEPAPETAVRATGWWREGLRKAKANPEYYLAVLFTWAHRLAVLLLPIVGLSLALVYRNKPRIFLYDHLLTAMNLLSFAFLTNAAGFMLPAPAAPFWFALLVVWTPVNMFQTLRGGYGSSILGAAVKTLIIWMTTVTAFGALMIGLILFSLAQL